MTAFIKLSETSRVFIERRKQREAMARQRALRKFELEMEKKDDLRSLIRALVIALFWVAGIAAMVTACDSKEYGAVRREPLAHSELSKDQLKILKATGERHGF